MSHEKAIRLERTSERPAPQSCAGRCSLCFDWAKTWMNQMEVEMSRGTRQALSCCSLLRQFPQVKRENSQFAFQSAKIKGVLKKELLQSYELSKKGNIDQYLDGDILINRTTNIGDCYIRAKVLSLINSPDDENAK
jgi:hypothetical protein